MSKFEYKVNSKATMELIEELNRNKDVYFRFQDPNIRLTKKSKSWGMIYSSAREAIADGSTVLNGKSCTETLEDLMQYAQYYDNNYIVMAFAGEYNGTGHDGECVCKYNGKVAVFNFDDIINFYNNEYKATLYNRLKEEYNNTKEELRRFKDWSILSKLERELSC